MRSSVPGHRKAAAALFLLLAAFCAKVGDPLPPLSYQPAPPSDLQLVQIGDRSQVFFTLPPEEVTAVELYRDCEGTTALSPQRDPAARFERSELSQQNENRRFFIDNDPELNRVCSYALRTVDSRGNRSALSAMVRSSALVPANPPRDLRHEIRQDQIIVRWEAPLNNLDGSQPSHVIGYLVNLEHFTEQTEYVDTRFQFGESRTYRIQSVTHRSEPLVVSEPVEIEITPRDRFAPDAPQNVTAVQVERAVRILWDFNRERDVEGYVVYRGTSLQDLEKASGLVTINSFQDNQVRSGRTYYYRVSAVDDSGNESPPSRTVSIELEP